MAPKPMPWFRYYSETRGDVKITKAARMAGVSRMEATGFWATLLSIANESPVRGALYVTLRDCYNIDDVTVECNAPRDVTEKIMAAFVSLDMLTIENGAWHITNWDKRQFSSDTSAERVRKYREKHRSNDDVTPTYVSVSESISVSDSGISDIKDNDPISDAFTNATGILPHDLDRWVKASQEMTQNGITPDEIPVTIQKMDKDGLQYSGLWSIKNTAIWVHNRRKNNQPIFTDNNPRAGGKPAKQSKADAAAAAFGVSGGTNGNG